MPPASTAVEAAIARCQLFMEAGADMAKPMGFDTIPEIKRVLREIAGPHMATLSQAAGPKARSLEDLEAAGVVRRDLPVGGAVCGREGGAQRAADAQAREFAGPCQEHLIPLDDYYDLVGLKPLLGREEAYDKAAAALGAEARGGVRQTPAVVRALTCRPRVSGTHTTAGRHVTSIAPHRLPMANDAQPPPGQRRNLPQRRRILPHHFRAGLFQLSRSWHATLLRKAVSSAAFAESLRGQPNPAARSTDRFRIT